MKTFLRILLYLLIAVVIIVGCGLLYVKNALPNVGPPPDITIEGTPAQIERGEYLANTVMLCMDCHSERDWSLYSGPTVAGTFGQGGEVFDEKMGFPGTYIAPNITPYNLGEWTDGEIFRAVTSGVSKDGRALFPIMPHPNYGKMDREDIESVIAYVRTLDPIEHETKESSSNFPMNFIINTIPKEPSFQDMPSPLDKVAYGKYVTHAAGCQDCHTKQEKGQFIGEEFAGGMNFELPNKTSIVSPNITPHDTGIGLWSEEKFVSHFKSFVDSSFVAHKVNEGENQTIMPWTMYGEMTEEDLSAIYQYLRSIEPVETVAMK